MHSYRSAAVLRRDDPNAADVARIVPASAEFLKVGAATLGYWSRPRKVRRKSYIGSVQRLSEAFSVLNDRHGGPVNTDDGESYLEAFAHLVAWNERARATMGRAEPDRQVIIDQITSTCRAWLMEIDPTMIARAALEAADAPKKYTADQFAKAWAITFAERSRLGLRSIGCCDMSKAKRKQAASGIKRESDRVRASETRRAQNARPQSRSDAEFCRLNGLPYRTFKRWKAKGRLDEYLTEVGLFQKWPEFVADIGTTYLLATKRGHSTNSNRAGRGHEAPQPASSGLVINIDPAALDRALAQVEVERQRAASRGAAASVSRKAHILYAVVVDALSADRRAA